MFFITNRAFVEGNASAEMRKVAFELNNNEAGQPSTSAGARRQKSLVELGSDTHEGNAQGRRTPKCSSTCNDSAQFPEITCSQLRKKSACSDYRTRISWIGPGHLPCDNPNPSRFP
jgi:hypothetical protein